MRTISVQQKRDREDADLAPASSDRRMSLQNVDWNDIFLRNSESYKPSDGYPAALPQEIKFVVLIPRAGREPFKIEFTLVEDQMFIMTRDGARNKCASASLYPSKLYVDSLFHGIDNATLSTCSIEPDPLSKAGRGYGAAVMLVVDVISSARGIPTSLSDVASFRDDTEPPVHAQYDITYTLVLKRGIGYYESRGFISTLFVKAEADKSKYAAHMRVDLEWSHMIVTTPILQLPSAIRGFYARVLELGDQVPEYTRVLYSQSFCEAHAARTQETFVNAWMANMMPKLMQSDFANASMRLLVLAIESDLLASTRLLNLELNEQVQTLMAYVWTRPLELNPENNNYQKPYPGIDLTKVFYKPDHGGTPQFNAVVPNPDVPGGVPVVQLQQVRTDLAVEFINTDDVRQSSRPLGTKSMQELQQF